MSLSRAPKKWLCVGLVVAAGVVVSSAALAGYTISTPVFIDSPYGEAWGQLSTARYSSDSYQDIGCSNGTTGYIQCWARDANDNYVYCASSSLGQYGNVTAGSINEGSFVAFTWTPSTGDCTSISVSNGSRYLH